MAASSPSSATARWPARPWPSTICCPSASTNLQPRERPMDMYFDRRLALADYLRGLAIGRLLEEVRADAEEAVALAIEMLTQPGDDKPDLLAGPSLRAPAGSPRPLAASP